jgi:hypothetical protein
LTGNINQPVKPVARPVGAEPEVEPEVAHPFGISREPRTAKAIVAMDKLQDEARRGRAYIETIDKAGILPKPAIKILCRIEVGRLNNKRVGVKWFDAIVSEIGDMAWRDRDRLIEGIQCALDAVPGVLERLGRATDCAWAQAFAENLGRVNGHVLGRTTYMSCHLERERDRRRAAKKRSAA